MVLATDSTPGMYSCGLKYLIFIEPTNFFVVGVDVMELVRPREHISEALVPL